jgi:hypothetical protein
MFVGGEGSRTSEVAMAKDATFERISAIVGDVPQSTFSDSVATFFAYLQKNLVLPLKVKGSEDFQWEEFYVIGPGDRREYARLRKDQPSYQDEYELVKIELGPVSKWMLFGGEDIAAYVKRLSDGKEFVLGLAELKSVGEASPSGRLLHDYCVFFANYR